MEGVVASASESGSMDEAGARAHTERGDTEPGLAWFV